MFPLPFLFSERLMYYQNEFTPFFFFYSIENNIGKSKCLKCKRMKMEKQKQNQIIIITFYQNEIIISVTVLIPNVNNEFFA